jgi:hypothetical protein
MNRTLGQNQFVCRTHASLKEVPTVGSPVGASHYHVRMHLRLSIPEGNVTNERKQFHLFVENADWIVLFRLPVEPSQNNKRLAKLLLQSWIDQPEAICRQNRRAGAFPRHYGRVRLDYR